MKKDDLNVLGDIPLSASSANGMSPPSSDSSSGVTPPPSAPGGKGSNNGKSDSVQNMSEAQTVAINARYHNGLKIFKSRCTDYEVAGQFLQDLFEQNVLGIRAAIQNKTDLRVCDVGCGDGVVTSQMMETLLRTTSASVDLELIEPVEEYLSLTAQKLSPLLESDFTFRFAPQRAELFFSEAVPIFDLVFSSHSFYFIPLETLLGISTSINNNGFLVIVAMSQDSIMTALKDMFSPKPTITADAILTFLKTSGLASQYEVEVFHRPSVLNLNGISLGLKSELTEETKNLLSLMIQKNIDDISDDEYESVKALILSKVHDGILELDSSYLVLRKHRAGG